MKSFDISYLRCPECGNNVFGQMIGPKQVSISCDVCDYRELKKIKYKKGIVVLK